MWTYGSYIGPVVEKPNYTVWKSQKYKTIITLWLKSRHLML